MEQEKVLLSPQSISEVDAKILPQFLVFASVSIVSFFMPFAFGHPQWLVGTIVNACLFLGALYLPKKYFIPLAILPSLGVLARGLVFGPFTFFLIYFLPFIWLGNLMLIFIFSRLTNASLIRANKGWTYFMFFSSVVKFGFLFLIANIYFNFGLVPKLFLATIGLNQLATALAGGLIALIILKLFNIRWKTNKI
jgi:hypothetical protein